MTPLESLFLGALQGVTEFLPVSSSGHLLLLRRFFGLAEIPLLYDVLLHVSTLAVIVLMFRQKIAAILLSLLRLPGRPRNGSSEADRENVNLAWKILVITAVTAVLGLLVSRLEAGLAGFPRLVALLFLATGLLLFATGFARGGRGTLQLGLPALLLIGLAQGLGVLPGISRSGITIAAALFCGLGREQAGELSFLIAIPAVLGALLLQLGEAGRLMAQVSAASLTAGIACSFCVGLVSLALLLKLVKRGRLWLFGFYLVPLGLVMFFTL
jgi:undecaprenyl-diphosphatase